MVTCSLCLCGGRDHSHPAECPSSVVTLPDWSIPTHRAQNGFNQPNYCVHQGYGCDSTAPGPQDVRAAIYCRPTASCWFFYRWTCVCTSCMCCYINKNIFRNSRIFSCYGVPNLYWIRPSRCSWHLGVGLLLSMTKVHFSVAVNPKWCFLRQSDISAAETTTQPDLFFFS
jgi:hypothetical protein